VYRWLGRYDRHRLEALEDRPSRPVRRRRPTWTLAELVAIRRLRARYPRWKFHEVTNAEPDLASLQVALLDWETTYNTVRPHQALGYITPAEYLASLGVDV
jgi:hypothetical protein